MTDLALQVAASKLAISVVLGAAVWLATRGDERPRLCHALCLTLLAALLIPPLIALPVLSPAAPAPGPAGALTFSVVQSAGPLGAGGAGGGGGVAEYAGFGVVLAWMLGAIAIVAWTMARARTFRGSMARASRDPCPDLQRMARKVGRTLGLEKVPTIQTTDAVVSPMVYRGRGTVRVLIPSALIEGLERSQLRWILAHELAHVRRRDHLVRWLEWLACAVFWWNPVAWWARRRLRAAGEVCCDALVLKVFDCAPRDYARSLVRALDLVRAERTSRPPVFASAAHGGRRTRHLEGRLRMIIANRPAAALSPALRTVFRGGLVVLLAFGLVYCGERTSPAAVEAPLVDAPLTQLSVSDLEVVEAPAAEDLAPPAEAGEPPSGYKLTGETYGELMDALDGLQAFDDGRPEVAAARFGSLACTGCHAGVARAEGRTDPVSFSFRASVATTAEGGWRLHWELSPNPHDDAASANAGATASPTTLTQWLPPGTIERVLRDSPPPARR